MDNTEIVERQSVKVFPRIFSHLSIYLEPCRMLSNLHCIRGNVFNWNIDARDSGSLASLYFFSL